MKLTGSATRSRLSRVLVSLTAALLLALALLMLSGCGGQSSNAVTVTIKGLQFNPATVTIQPGTTIRWVNGDQTAHTSTSDDWKEGTSNPEAWNSPALNPGESFERTFETAGTFKYHCSVHPYMHGTVVVK